MLRRGSVLVTCAALVLASGVTTAGEAVATERRCGDDGPDLRYLVLFEPGTPRHRAVAETEAACGTITVYYPEIAVGVASAASPVFAERIGYHRAFSAEAQRLGTGRSGASRSVGSALPGRQGTTRVPAGDRTREQWNMRAIKAEAARSVEDGNTDVVVGVLDSGIDAAHPELAGSLAPSLSAGCLTGEPVRSAAAWRPTTSPHGTHVAGILAAADDGRGITGVAPGVRLASVRVIDDHGHADPEAVVCGLMWAARQGMAVTNSSYLVAPWSMACAPGEGRRVVRQAISRAVAFAESAGTLNVAAASNQAAALTPSPVGESAAGAARGTCEALPAALPETLAVSAVDENDVKAGYSSYGLGVIDLTAPGGESDDCVLSTVPGGYDEACGTSMAAPHVTGVAALLKSRYPGTTPHELRETLGDRARPIACPADYDLSGDGTQDAYCAGYASYNGFYGDGMVDALAAVSSAPGSAPSPKPETSEDEHGQESGVAERDVEKPDEVEPPGEDVPAERRGAAPEQQLLSGMLHGLGNVVSAEPR